MYYSPLSHGEGGSTPLEQNTYLKVGAKQNGAPSPIARGLEKLPGCLLHLHLSKLIEQIKNTGCPIKFDFQTNNKGIFV